LAGLLVKREENSDNDHRSVNESSENSNSSSSTSDKFKKQHHHKHRHKNHHKHKHNEKTDDNKLRKNEKKKKNDKDILSMISKIKRKRGKEETSGLESRKQLSSVDEVETNKSQNFSSALSSSSELLSSISHSSLPPDFRSRSNKLRDYELKLFNYRMARRHYGSSSRFRVSHDRSENIVKKKY
jgi:hypothetical protein